MQPQTVHTNQRQTRFRWIVFIAIVALLTGGWFLLTSNRGQPAKSVGSVPSTGADALAPAPMAGHPAPGFTLATLDGEQISLADLAGQPVILNFWASWCGPCRVEMPELQAAHVNQGEEGVVVLGVNLTKREGNLDDLPAFVQEFGLTFPVVLDVDGAVARLYEVRGQPVSVFIDRDGVVQTVWNGPVNEAFIAEQIDALLGS